MGLFLSVISYHQLSPSLKVRFSLENNTAVIGRSPNCDWHLPDNEKILSSKHAEVTQVVDKYYVTDISTNGVFVNQADKPLGKGNRHELKPGDKLTLGEYVIAVEIENVSVPQSVEPAHARSQVSNPIQTPSDVTQQTAFTSAPEMISEDPFIAGASMQDNFVMGNNIIPDDWSWDEQTDNIKVEENKPEAVDTVSVSSTKRAETAQDPTSLLQSEEQKYSGRQTPRAKNVAQPDSASHEWGAPIDALLKGLGIEQNAVVDQPPEWWFDLGQSVRSMNEELLESLRERAAFKNQFRVNRTMFKMKENNPYKFSGSAEDLFRNLFLRSNNSFMTTQDAITEAFADLRKHEQSMRAGLEGAVIGILQQISPDEISQETLDPGLLDRFQRGKKEQRLWRKFKALHDDIISEISVNREAILSDAFVKAYEDKQKQG